jgi:hypothetical protein
LPVTSSTMGRELDGYSLISQRPQRIQSRSTDRWNISGYQRDADQSGYSDGNGQGVVLLYAI